MIAFLGSFLQYFIILVLLVGVAVLGLFAGKALRKRKNAKESGAVQDTNKN